MTPTLPDLATGRMGVPSAEKAEGQVQCEGPGVGGSEHKVGSRCSSNG